MPFRLGPWELMLIFIIGLLVILPFWKIFSKAGYPGWLSLTQVVPVINIMVLFFFAFSEWPIRLAHPKACGTLQTRTPLN